MADHGTVSKAADVLHITQPALSRQVRSLEEQAGFMLFERAGRRLTLTPRGEQFLVECRGLFDPMPAPLAIAPGNCEGEIGVLRVASSAMVFTAVFPAFLRRYADAVPGVRLALIDAIAADHLTMLERGEADLSISVLNMLPVDDRRFASYPLPGAQMLVACAPSFAMAPGNPIEIAELAEHPLLLLDRTYATRNVFDAACRLADFKPNIFFESRSVNALLAMAEAGHGSSDSSIHHTGRPDEILRTRLITLRREPLQFTLAVVWDKQRAPVRHAEEFSSLLAGYLRAMLPAAAALPGQRPPSATRQRVPNAARVTSVMNSRRPRSLRLPVKFSGRAAVYRLPKAALCRPARLPNSAWHYHSR